MFWHVTHYIKKGQKSVIQIVDTDIEVLPISFIQTVAELDELYISVGTGKQFNIIHSSDCWLLRNFYI